MPQLNSKSQVTIPKSIREHLGIGPGESVEFVVIDNHVEVRPAASPSAFKSGRHLFGRWDSGTADTSANRKLLLNEHLGEKQARRHR
jgi:AbrB family looped-hinge helix DNA binding protein